MCVWVYLQDTHAECVPQDLVGLVVVAVADGGGCYKQLKRVVLAHVQSATLELLLQQTHALFTMTARDRIYNCLEVCRIAHISTSSPAEAKVLLVAPQH